MSDSTKKYREDIDGLRAIAIVSVVIFHMFPEQFPGGFAGVDIFFVISGYLISSIIISQLAQNNFSFTDFYMKRVLRLFPSLLIVLSFVLLFGWFILLPSEYQQLGKHSAAGTGFVANIVLFKEVNYFNKVSELKPLLHLWSLGIEEQFYFLWPVLLFCVWKVNSKYVSIVTILCLFISFIINISKVSSKPEFAFFMPQSRFWEIFFGCLIGYFDYKKWIKLSSRSSFVFLSLGLLLCVVSFITLRGDLKFPGYFALLPCLGAGFVIISNSTSKINKLVLGNRMLVFIGLVSYPFYLWHWPLLSFSQIIYNSPATIFVRFALMGISFLLAIVTYKYVEKPLKGLPLSIKKKFALSLIIFSLVIGAVGFSIFKKVISPLASFTGINQVDLALDDWDYPGRLDKKYNEEGVLFYSKGNLNRKVIYIGDSNIEQYYPRIEKLAAEPSSPGVIFTTGGGCLPIPGVGNDLKQHCQMRIDYGYKIAKEDPTIKNVVIAAQWAAYLSNSKDFYLVVNGQKILIDDNFELIQLAFGELQKEIKKLLRLKKKVFVVFNIPIGENFDPLYSLERGLIPPRILYKEHYVLREDFEKKYDKGFLFLRKILKSSGAKIIDPLDFLCDASSGKCQISIENQVPIYKDREHLRPFFVRDYITYLDETMNISN